MEPPLAKLSPSLLCEEGVPIRRSSIIKTSGDMFYKSVHAAGKMVAFLGRTKSGVC